MGRTEVRFSITGSRSSHNSPQDDTDRAIFGLLNDRLRRIVDQYAYLYPQLGLDLIGPDPDALPDPADDDALVEVDPDPDAVVIGSGTAPVVADGE